MHNQVRQIIAIYCLCDDFLRAWGHTDAPQAKITTAEVMTVALVAITLFHGNQERSRCFLTGHGYIQRMPHKGNFNRKLHKTPEATWQALFSLLAQVHKQANDAQHYVVDSLLWTACPCPSVITTASAAATSTRAGSTARRSGATSLAKL